MELRKIVEVSVMAGAALLEVGGDALIRKGLRGSGISIVVLGFVILGTYGVVVNLLEVDFSKLLGAYVGIFAVTSILVGWLVFRDQIAMSTWLGVAVVLAGSLIIQFGPSPSPASSSDRPAPGHDSFGTK